MIFYYQARTTKGEIKSGKVEASSRESALSLLKGHGFYVTFLEEEKPKFYEKRINLFNKISLKEIIIFARQLATMFKSEIPAVEVFETVAKQVKNNYFKEKIREMMDKIEGGSSISKTLSDYPDIFSPFFVNMVRSGEASGKMSDVFSYLADYFEKDYDFKVKVRGALIYPIFLSVVFIGVIGILIFFVFPQLEKFILDANAQVPSTTKFFFSLFGFIRSWGWLLLLLPLIAFFVLYFYIKKTREGKELFDEFILKIPFLKSLLKNIYLSRISLNLSTLISGGLPIVKSLEITSSVVGNSVYEKIILEASNEVKKGEMISYVISKYPDFFPPFFSQIVAVGEKTGQLTPSLKNASEFYQKEVESGLDSFIKILEPVLIVFFGILVGFLVASVILPLYQTITAV
jgi:type IV pilus assembly protein PilC